MTSRINFPAHPLLVRRIKIVNVWKHIRNIVFVFVKNLAKHLSSEQARELVARALRPYLRTRSLRCIVYYYLFVVNIRIAPV